MLPCRLCQLKNRFYRPDKWSGAALYTKTNVKTLVKTYKNTYIYNMKNLQISLDSNIITFIEKITKEQHKTRSAVIREAISYWIQHKTIEEFENQWISALKEEEPDYTKEDEAWMDAEQWDEQ
ncbi:MAG: CopG family transcriptional regulator [Spirochaetales bacterium]|nr:CopG family transcriptional regulator [Spirochaetales bacterium]